MSLYKQRLAQYVVGTVFFESNTVNGLQINKYCRFKNNLFQGLIDSYSVSILNFYMFSDIVKCDDSAIIYKARLFDGLIYSYRL